MEWHITQLKTHSTSILLYPIDIMLIMYKDTFCNIVVVPLFQVFCFLKITFKMWFYY